MNAYLLLDLVKAWGDGTSVAADGTQVDTLIDNLLAESHIRHGGYGGIAYHHVADNYIALFSHFIPCGVAEAYNGFSAWLLFGGEVIERNDPAEQEKIIKFNSLVANCVIFHTALDIPCRRRVRSGSRVGS